MSDEKSKGISLRRKKTTRPTISAPRQISQPREASADSRPTASRQNSAWDAQSTASGVSQGQDKTSDLVKRRYSTRFAGGLPQQDGGVPPMPAMPNIPAHYLDAGRQRDSRSQSRGRSPGGEVGKLKVDMRALKDPNLQADKYVQSILSDATETDIQAYTSNLQDVKSHASTDLQQNVYQNRTQFIKISKEADKLKSEMRTLRTLLSELTQALGHATSAGGQDLTNNSLTVADRKRANRSSVANLEAMWSTHLQTLWKRVEGSQKYLPALPGRHIVMESQRWLELNAATWKPRRRVALVLLNDHILVASEKKRKDLINATPDAKNKRQSVYSSPAQQSQQTTYVAERCWALQDVNLADISTSAETSAKNAAMSNAINIRAGNESFTYATSDNVEKAGLLVAFRKAQEDLRKQMAAEHGERERQLDEVALLTGRDQGLLKTVAAAEGASATGLSRSNSVLVDVEGRQQSLRAVEAQLDTLDIDIALQRFDAAVARVETLRKLARGVRSNATIADLIATRVQERAAHLARILARQVTLSSAAADRTKQHVAWMLRLGFEDLARARYLASRSETIRIRTRQLPFTGALVPYVHALAFTTFTLLLHTFRTFHAAFSAASGSAVVKWASEQVTVFNAVLARQMSTVDPSSPLWTECVDTVKGQAAVLSEVGVDFKGLVARDLEADVARAKAVALVGAGLVDSPSGTVGSPAGGVGSPSAEVASEKGKEKEKEATVAVGLGVTGTGIDTAS